jgi:Fic family protein
MLSFELKSDLIGQLSTLNQKIIQKQVLIQSLSREDQDAIYKLARVSQIGASTRIENAILTDAEVFWIDTMLVREAKTTAYKKFEQQIKNKLSKDRERSIEEVAGCRNMLFLIYEQARDLIPFTESTLRGLHAELLRYYPKAKHYLGQYKTMTNSVVEINQVTNEQRVMFKTADPGPVTQSAMTDLLSWYHQALIKCPWTLVVACEFVFRFLAIHPFQDGNGRLGRGLFLFLLLQSPDITLAQVSRYVAIDRQIEKHKEEYYLVLQRCSGAKYLTNPKKYKVEYFLKFMLKIFDEALDDIDYYIDRVKTTKKLSETAQKVLQCMKDFPEKKMQTKDIVQQTRLPRRTAIYSLNTLLTAGLIQKYGQGAATQYQVVF